MKQKQAKLARNGLLCLVLALGTVAVYWPVRHFEFLNFDDGTYVTANPHVFRGLSMANLVWAFTDMGAANWHPLTWISHMLDCQLFGYEAGGHHLTNLLFHAANTVLLFGLFLRLTGAAFRSAIVAALFAWHPLHVESVAWIAERKDVLSTFIGLLTLLAYAQYAEKSEIRNPIPPQRDEPRKKVSNLQYSPFENPRVYYGLSLSFYALGLMSKPMLVTLPFVILLLDYWPLQRFKLNTEHWTLRTVYSRRLLLKEKLPFFFLAALDSIITTVAQKSGEAVVGTAALPIGSRLANAVMAYVGYLRKAIWPSDLAPYYPYRHHVPMGDVVGALLVLGLVSALAVRLARRAPYLLVGWLWYLGMLVPVIGLVQVGAQSMADRYTYLPLVGIFLMLVWGCGDLMNSLRQRVALAGVVSAIILGSCLGVTWRQNLYWHDSETLFRRDLELFPRANAMAQHCLGRALFERGADAEALPHLEEVARLLPDFVPGHLNLANCLSRQGRFEEALAHYREAIRLKPENAEGYKALGSSLASQMRLDEARTNFLTAIRYKPDYAEAYMRLGMAEMAQGQADEALQHLMKAVEIYPDYHEGQYYLAHALEDRSRFEEAALHFRAAIRANPAYAAAIQDLAWMLVTEVPGHPRLEEAISLARRACELTRFSHAPYLETLAAANSEAGRFSEAIEAVENGIAAAGAAGDKDGMARMQKQLEGYRAGRSYSGQPVANPSHPP